MRLSISSVLPVIFFVWGCGDQGDGSSVEIPHQDSGVNFQCIRYSNETPIIVNTQAGYQALWDREGIPTVCGSYVFPEIDFSKKTLLGQYVSAGGCSIAFSVRVTRNDPEQWIRHHVSVAAQGSCEKLGYSLNLVVVDKVPATFDVRFTKG